MATVTLEGLGKAFSGGGRALRGLQLHVEDGEFLTLVGPSGCGKSTTLQLIAGLDQASEGRVLIGGQDVTRLSPGQRDIAMVFQSYALYPHLTVAQNLAFPLQVARRPKAETDAKVDEVAQRLGLVPLLARRPKDLSGGQRQRVALGRALVRRPKVFLFDEPLSNLDPALRSQLRGELKKLHQELQASFIYVTHDQLEAMTLSDRIAVLSQGALEQVAPPEEIYRRPETLFVASFFGSPSLNVFGPGQTAVTVEPETLLGVRPEQVEVGTGAAPEGALPGRIYLVEPAGPETWVTLETGGARVIGRAGPRFSGAPSGPAWLRFEATARMWFDRRTHKRRAQP